MRFPSVVLFAVLVAALHTSCEKDPILQTVYKDTTITGNQPPNYTGVPTVKIQLYVNKLYVDILGREPDATELQTQTNLLVTQDLSQSAREQIVEQLTNDTLYYRRLYELTASDFINGADRTLINGRIAQLELAAYLDSVNGNTQFLFVYDYEIERLTKLKNATQEFYNATIDVNEFYRRFVDNEIYDQINMGSLNFVVAAFDDLFRRAPTTAELTNGVAMVDNAPSTLLLMDGSNKGDFMHIVTHANAFYEGLVRRTYLQLLLREPASEETGAGIALVKPNGEIEKLQKQLLTSKEYAGF